MSASEKKHPQRQSQMRVQSVRFSEQMWQAVQAEAHLEGVSASQFIRESAIARVAWNASRRKEGAAVWDALMQEVRRVTRDRD